MSDGRNPALELLRVVAIALLVLYHVASLAPAQGRAHRLFAVLGGAGYVGTDLLLALAGFLSVGSRARAADTPSWLRRRLWRVFPALAVFLLGYLYLIPALLGLCGVSAASLPNYADLSRAKSLQWTMWTFTANLVMVLGQRLGAALEPLLTLGLGAQLTVLAAWLLPSRRRLLIGAGVIVMSGIVLRALWLSGDPYVPYSFPLSRGEGFFLGAAAAAVLRSSDKATLLAWRHRLLLGSSVVMLAVFLASKGLLLTSALVKTVGYPAIGLWSASVVLWLSQVSRRPRLLASIARLGRGTYVAYLAKLPLCFVVGSYLIRPHHLGVLTFIAISLCATLLVGTLGHVAVERPFSWRAPRRRAIEVELP
jgi:peptidoglycan/LPS O-acetylase OafA/YrhL